MVITGSARPYDPQRNPAYQIDHTVDLSGKVVASTKRRVRFTFGFSNAEALEAGAVGLGCRGSEHTVELVWSITSGKRRILMDNREVHFSIAPHTEAKFSHSWVMPGNVTMTLIAHAAAMSSKSDAPEDWKQYDLLVDDLSYFEMPKVFQLGIEPAAAKSAGNGAPGFATAAAQPQQPAKVETMDLLDFSEPTPAPTAVPPQGPAYRAPPQPQNAPAAMPKVQDHAFAFAAPATHPSSPPQHAPEQPASQPVPSSPPVSPGAPPATAPITNTHGPVAAPSDVPLVSPVTPTQEEEEPAAQEQQPGVLGLESAMKNNLANFDLGFPSSPASSQENKLTMMGPIPGMTESAQPAQAQQSLAEMKAGHEHAAKSGPAREVMRAVSPTPATGMVTQQQQQQQPGGGYGYPQHAQQQQGGGYGSYQQSYPASYQQSYPAY